MWCIQYYHLISRRSVAELRNQSVSTTICTLYVLLSICNIEVKPRSIPGNIRLAHTTKTSPWNVSLAHSIMQVSNLLFSRMCKFWKWLRDRGDGKKCLRSHCRYSGVILEAHTKYPEGRGFGSTCLCCHCGGNCYRITASSRGGCLNHWTA